MDRILRYLDTAGDGSGTKIAIGNYATATQFFIAPPAGEIYNIHRLLIHLEDSMIDADAYGATAAGALSNGVIVQMRRGDTEVLEDFTDGVPIKTSAQWARIMFDAESKDWGSGDVFMTARLSFNKFGGPLKLYGDKGDRLTVILEDDMRHLIDHTFMAQGEKGH